MCSVGLTAHLRFNGCQADQGISAGPKTGMLMEQVAVENWMVVMLLLISCSSDFEVYADWLALAKSGKGTPAIGVTASQFDCV